MFASKKTKRRYKTLCTIVKVEERFKQRHTGGLNKDAKFANESTGWWAVLPGHLSMHLGSDKPAVKAGQMAVLILEVQEC